MTVDDINVDEAIAGIKALLKEDKTISPDLRTAIEVIIFLVTVLSSRLGLNSRNSNVHEITSGFI